MSITNAANYNHQDLVQILTQLSRDIETERSKLIAMLDNGLASPIVIKQSQKLDKLITRYTGFKMTIGQYK